MPRMRGNSKSAAFTAASSVALGANGSRWSITFSPALVEGYSVGFGETAVINAGLTIRAGMQPLTLTREQLGDAITLPIHIVGTGNAAAPLLEVSEA